MTLSGKKILIFTPKGIEGRYGKEIYNELNSRGALVEVHPERPFLNTFYKIVFRIFKKFSARIFSNYLKNSLSQYPENNFDYILVIRGELFTKNAVKLLRKSNPNAFIILYLWDILYVNDKSDIIRYFDKAISFDRRDVGQYSELNFRPLFYLAEQCKIVNSIKTYDLLFAGTMHSVRYKVLNSIKKKYAGRLNMFFYYFLPSKLVFINNIMRKDIPIKAKISDFNYQMLSEKSLYEKMSNSKAIIDILYPGQDSLSMRVMEAMASNIKLITDYEGIKKYDFYNANNISVINSANPIIDQNFINDISYIEVPEEIKEKYGVKKWVDDVFFNCTRVENFMNQ